MVNIIFLDFDGVLNNAAKAVEYKHSLNHPTDDLSEKVKNMINLLDEYNVRNLKIICDHVPNLHFVISSSWRNSLSLEEIAQILNFFHIKTPILGKTSQKNDRGEEILSWIIHNLSPSNFYSSSVGTIAINELAVLDDRFIFPLNKEYEFLQKRFFKTNSKNGLTYTEALEIMRHFIPDFKEPRIKL